MSRYALSAADTDVTALAVDARLTYPANHRHHGIELNVTGLQESAQRAASWLARELGVEVDVVRVTQAGAKRVVISSHR